MEDELNDMNELNGKLKFFLENKIRIHIDLFDGTYLNGFLIKIIREDVWWLQEDRLGKIFVFVRDIKKLQQHFNLNKRGKNGKDTSK